MGDEGQDGIAGEVAEKMVRGVQGCGEALPHQEVLKPELGWHRWERAACKMQQSCTCGGFSCCLCMFMFLCQCARTFCTLGCSPGQPLAVNSGRDGICIDAASQQPCQEVNVAFSCVFRVARCCECRDAVVAALDLSHQLRDLPVAKHQGLPCSRTLLWYGVSTHLHLFVH
jgi:hypothetical protein